MADDIFSGDGSLLGSPASVGTTTNADWFGSLTNSLSTAADAYAKVQTAINTGKTANAQTANAPSTATLASAGSLTKWLPYILGGAVVLALGAFLIFKKR